MVHDMMKRVAIADRRLKLISNLEVTLTAADKEAIKASMSEKAAELGVDASKLVGEIPTTCVAALRPRTLRNQTCMVLR